MAGITRVAVVRSGLGESVHEVDVAVVDAEGSVVASSGDPGTVAYARSCMKPVQAAVSMALAGLDYSDREAAVMCASHNAEPVHLEAVRAVLARGGVEEAALRCPAMLPGDQESAMAAPRKLAINSDCSGKHAGMLAASRARGWPLETYRDPDHPLQQRVLAGALVATGLPDVRVGVDGCGVPVHGFALARMARVYATLAVPERFGDDLAAWAERAVGAMRAEPYLVAGRNRLDTAVIRRTEGAVIVKAGAEGMMCASALGRRLGIALKVRDGSRRATSPAMVAVLRHLELLSDEDVEELRPFAHPHVLGGGEPVGELQTHVELAAAD